jgi:hypothetical protein
MHRRLAPSKYIRAVAGGCSTPTDSGLNTLQPDRHRRSTTVRCTADGTVAWQVRDLSRWHRTVAGGRRILAAPAGGKLLAWSWLFRGQCKRVGLRQHSGTL